MIFIVMCARYNYACYLQDIGLKDSVALVQLRDAARASEKLCGMDAPLTLQIQRAPCGDVGVSRPQETGVGISCGVGDHL